MSTVSSPASKSNGCLGLCTGEPVADILPSTNPAATRLKESEIPLSRPERITAAVDARRSEDRL